MFPRSRIFLLSLIIFVVGIGALVVMLTPMTELTRFRNSLVATTGTPGDFHWTPKNVPVGYQNESLDAPTLMRAWAQVEANQADELGRMSAIVAHLRGRPKRKGPIKAATLEAYRLITERGLGYCADYTQVFNGLAHAASLPVREWGMSFHHFDGDGHAFNEVWSTKTQGWVFVDPLNAFYVADSKSGRALSVLEFRSRLNQVNGFESLTFIGIGDAFRFDSPQQAFSYYKNGADQFFLWFGNHVFTYDRHPVVRFFGSFSRSLEQLAAISIGIHPQIRILPTSNNVLEIQALYSFRARVLFLSGLALLAGLVLIFEIGRHWRGRSRQLVSNERNRQSIR